MGLPLVCVLGSPRVTVDGVVCPIAGARKRSILAAIALFSGSEIRAETLLDIVWAGAAPVTGLKALRVHVSELRAQLRNIGVDGVVATTDHGYRFNREVARLDVDELAAVLDAGSSSPLDRLRQVEAVLEPIDGSAYADLGDHLLAIEARTGVDEMLAALREEQLALELRHRPQRGLLRTARALVAEAPYREERHRLLVAASYCWAGQAAALEAYQQARSMLRDDLGLDPSDALRGAERAVLANDPEALGLGPPAAPVAVGTTGDAIDTPDDPLDAFRAQLSSPFDDPLAQLEVLCGHLADAGSAAPADLVVHHCTEYGELLEAGGEVARAAAMFRIARVRQESVGQPALAHRVAEARCHHRAGRSELVSQLCQQGAKRAAAENDHEAVAELLLLQSFQRSGAAQQPGDLDRDRLEVVERLGEQRPDLRVRLLAESAASRLLVDAAAARELAQRGLGIARAGDDAYVLGEALGGMHQADWRPANLAERLDIAIEAVQVADQANHPVQRSQARLFLISDWVEAGRIEAARAELDTALLIAERGGDTRQRWACTMWQALLGVIDDEPELALHHAGAALALWGDDPNPDAISAYGSLYSNLQLRSDDPLAAVPLISAALAENPGIRSLRIVLAAALSLGGAPGDAAAQLELLGADPLEAVHDGPARLAGLAMLTETALALARDDLLEVLAHELEPMAASHVVSNIFGGGGFYWGPVARLIERIDAARAG